MLELILKSSENCDRHNVSDEVIRAIENMCIHTYLQFMTCRLLLKFVMNEILKIFGRQTNRVDETSLWPTLVPVDAKSGGGEGRGRDQIHFVTLPKAQELTSYSGRPIILVQYSKAKAINHHLWLNLCWGKIKEILVPSRLYSLVMALWGTTPKWFRILFRSF